MNQQAIRLGNDCKAMSHVAASSTSRRGWRKVRDGLFTPAILAIIGATLAAESASIVGENAIARAIGMRPSNSLSAFMLGALVATTLLVLAGVVAVLSGGVNLDSWLPCRTMDRQGPRRTGAGLASPSQSAVHGRDSSLHVEFRCRSRSGRPLRRPRCRIEVLHESG